MLHNDITSYDVALRKAMKAHVIHPFVKISVTGPVYQGQGGPRTATFIGFRDEQGGACEFRLEDAPLEWRPCPHLQC